MYEVGKQVDGLLAENRGLEMAIKGTDEFKTDAERIIELGRVKSELESWKERNRMTSFLEQENQILRHAEVTTQQLISESQTENRRLQTLVAEKDSEVWSLKSDLESLQQRIEETQTRNKALEIQLESVTHQNNTCNSFQVEEFQEQVREFQEEKLKLIEENAFSKREVKRLHQEAAELRNRLLTVEKLLVNEREKSEHMMSVKRQNTEMLQTGLSKTTQKYQNLSAVPGSTRDTITHPEYESLHRQAQDHSTRWSCKHQVSPVFGQSVPASTIRFQTDISSVRHRGVCHLCMHETQVPVENDQESSSEQAAASFLQVQKSKVQKLKELSKRFETMLP